MKRFTTLLRVAAMAVIFATMASSAPSQCAPAYGTPVDVPSVHFVPLGAQSVPDCAQNAAICTTPNYTSSVLLPGINRKWIRLSGWHGSIDVVWMDTACTGIVHQQCVNIIQGGQEFWIVVLDEFQPLLMVLQSTAPDTIRIDRRPDQGMPGTQEYPQQCQVSIDPYHSSAAPVTYRSFDFIRGTQGPEQQHPPEGVARRSDGQLVFRK